MIEWVNAITAVLFTAGLLATALGYRHSLMQWEKSPEWYFAAGKICISSSFGLLLVVWAAWWGLLRLHDVSLATTIVHSPISGVFNFFAMWLGIVGTYFSLKARHLILSEEEQKDWHWWSAWMHPELRAFRFRRR